MKTFGMTLIFCSMALLLFSYTQTLMSTVPHVSNCFSYDGICLDYTDTPHKVYEKPSPKKSLAKPVSRQ